MTQYLYLAMNQLLLFVKNPIAGRTKTRLAASVGHDKALDMYQMLLDYTRSQTDALVGVKRLLMYSEAIMKADGWSDDGYQKMVQQGEGLGERMTNAFANAFSDGGTKVIIIGSDCPGITTQILEKAFRALATSEVVIGPALDGGYYLLGMNAYYPDLFMNINWSTERVAEQTRERAATQGLGVTELEPLSDVDTLEDWLGYGWEIPA